MTDQRLTEIGRSYLRAVYLAGGQNQPVGPARIGKIVGVSRVTALEHLRKLAHRGYGTYIQGKGLLLNKEGAGMTQEDIWRHHVVEHIFSIVMDHLPHDMVCDEAAKTSTHFSRDFLDMAYEKMGRPGRGQCGCSIEPPFIRSEMMGCGWFRKTLGDQE